MDTNEETRPAARLHPHICIDGALISVSEGEECNWCGWRSQNYVANETIENGESK